MVTLAAAAAGTTVTALGGRRGGGSAREMGSPAGTRGCLYPWTGMPVFLNVVFSHFHGCEPLCSFTAPPAFPHMH
jgi:hypothetical protein